MDLNWIVLNEERDYIPGKLQSYALHPGSGLLFRVFVNHRFSYIVYDGRMRCNAVWSEDSYPTEEQARSEAQSAGERYLAGSLKDALSPDQFYD